MKKKIFIFSIIFIIFFAFATWYYIFEYSKTHHRNVADEKGITIEAAALVSDFQKNEPGANAKYLNKAVEVIGKLADINKDQAGNTTLTLKSEDPFSYVFCTLKTKEPLHVKDSTIKVKGICTGFLSDVVINEAIIEP
jgi:hypothetical protein